MWNEQKSWQLDKDQEWVSEGGRWGVARCSAFCFLSLHHWHWHFLCFWIPFLTFFSTFRCCNTPFHHSLRTTSPSSKKTLSLSLSLSKNTHSSSYVLSPFEFWWSYRFLVMVSFIPESWSWFSFSFNSPLEILIFSCAYMDNDPGKSSEHHSWLTCVGRGSWGCMDRWWSPGNQWQRYHHYRH